MTSPESIELVRRARQGDREAADALLRHYYSIWERRWAGKLGTGLREILETQDLIQTAAREAFRKLPALKDDAKFFAWFERIIARKIASYRRRVRREEAAIAKKLEDKDGKSTTAEPAFVTEEEHRKLKRLIRDLSEPYPREMRVIELVYFKKLEFKAIGKKLDISERNLFRLRDKGLELLRKRMYPK